MITVSVIIPNYNHGSFLKQRIDSVLNQTYRNFEVIILDDYSNDNSKDIIERYRNHPKVNHIIYNQENGGNTFKQWERGIMKAKGEFIWLAESDDYADIYFLENLVPIISSNKSIGVVFCDSNVVNADGLIIDNTRNWCPKLFETDKLFERKLIQRGKYVLFEYLIYYNIIPNASAAVFRKDPVLENISWIDISLKNCGDWKLWINILLQFDIAHIDRNLNFFRRHGNNVTNSDFVIKTEITKILKEVIKTTYNKEELSKLFNSLLIWSFNNAYWDRNLRLHHKNVYLYFKHNLNLLSTQKFFSYFLQSSN